MHTSKARRPIAAGLLTTLALAGSALVTEPASAATTQDVVYSTDGGTTWTTTPTVAPGATVLVRQWFDNTDDLHATAASETTTLPARFTHNGTTQVCLNPSTTTITSPNGTAAVGLAQLMNNDALRNLFSKALNAAKTRAEELEQS